MLPLFSRLLGIRTSTSRALGSGTAGLHVLAYLNGLSATARWIAVEDKDLKKKLKWFLFLLCKKVLELFKNGEPVIELANLFL